MSLAQGLVLAPALTLILSRLASGGGDGVVTLWREGAGGGFEASARCDAKCVVRGLAALPGGGFAQVGNDGVLKVWGAAGGLDTKTEPVGGYPYPSPYPLPLPLPLPRALRGGDEPRALLRSPGRRVAEYPPLRPALAHSPQVRARARAKGRVRARVRVRGRGRVRPS